MNNDELIMRILTATAFDHCDDIWWRVDGKYAPLTIFVNCNDLFFWGYSDVETITIDNIAKFEKAYKDSEYDGGILFCCRVRGMRPQGLYYKYLADAEKPLFDACGPEREIGLENPGGQTPTTELTEKENAL